ncbi:LAME_0E09120g1_1 [Lachancea meyersii CBS 8951]|uniref:LAME_0E09120g1_1 n=1 Tax=Lachancea meyersii CBS 8951 TaxID=1266667 RepID=A0A1G4JJM0_9SACH|nr:LAME_0E09120g1_1 [Lachancea meyersii CBS 8951]
MLRERRKADRSAKTRPEPESLDEDDRNARTHFTLLDVLRMVGGLVILGLLTGKFMTGSVTWDYWTKSSPVGDLTIPSAYWSGQELPLAFSLEQLHEFDGSRPKTPVLLAIQGQVFDVSRKSGLYGPRGPYHRLAATDCSRAFSYRLWSMQGLREPCSSDLNGLSDSARQRVAEWTEFFQTRYPCVGYLTGSEP